MGCISDKPRTTI